MLYYSRNLKEFMDSDLIIIGAGPAGAVAGLTASKLGLKTTIIDKEQFPRDKPCGGGLTANAIDFLVENDLLKLLDDLEKFSFTGYRIYSAKNQIVKAPLKTKHNVKKGFVVRRADFDNALLGEAVKAGCNFAPQTKADSVKQNSEGVEVKAGSKSFRAKKAIVADGSGISLTKKILPNALAAETLAAMAIFKDIKFNTDDLMFFLDENVGYGYGWVFLLPDGRANIGAGADIKFIKKNEGNVKDLFYEFLERPPIKKIIGDGKIESKIRSFPLRMKYPNAVFRKENILFAGDAANLIYPLTGEGISYAMKSGKTAAEIIEKSLKKSDDNVLDEYRHLLTNYYPEFKNFKVAWLLKKNLSWPWFQNYLFNSAAKDEYVSEMAIGALENTVSCKRLFHPKILFTLFYKGIFGSPRINRKSID